jgi:hypothetical protein
MADMHFGASAVRWHAVDDRWSQGSKNIPNRFAVDLVEQNPMKRNKYFKNKRGDFQLLK